MVIDYSEFAQAREQWEEMRDFEDLCAAEYAYDGYAPLDEDEMDGYHIVYDTDAE